MNEGVDTSRFPSTQEIRDWAAGKDGNLKMRGMLPRYLIAAWNKAHPDRPFVGSNSFHGTPSGYSKKGCRCDRCLRAGRGYAREGYHLRDIDGGVTR